jgi:hypothetical protein
LWAAYTNAFSGGETAGISNNFSIYAKSTKNPNKGLIEFSGS